MEIILFKCSKNYKEMTKEKIKIFQTDDFLMLYSIFICMLWYITKKYWLKFLFYDDLAGNFLDFRLTLILLGTTLEN